MVNHIYYPTWIWTTFSEIFEEAVIANHNVVLVPFILRVLKEIEILASFSQPLFFGKTAKDMKTNGNFDVAGLRWSLHSFCILGVCNLIVKHDKPFIYFHWPLVSGNQDSFSIFICQLKVFFFLTIWY